MMNLYRYRNRYALALLLLCNLPSIAQKVTAEKVITDSVKAGSVINTLYGTTEKKALTYSVSTVFSKDIINNSSFLPGNSLYGKLPGLTVIQRTSEPGNDEPTFFLRGRSTTKTNAPIMIVDGIERNLNEVQLEDIESISVLKDAVSTVMFGVRAANGVLLVTTKRGKAGKTKISGNIEQLYLAPTRVPKFRSSADYAKLYNQALANDGLSPLYTSADIAGFESGARGYSNVDWRNETVADHTQGTRANVNVTGGDKFASYYVSLGYFHQGGIYKNTDKNEGYSTNINLDNFSFRSNFDINVNENWTFALDLAGRINEKNAPVSGTDAIWDLLYKYPSHLFPVYTAENVYGGSTIYPNNPVGYINSRGYTKTNNRTIFTTLSTKYDFQKIIKGLTGGLKYAYDNFYSNREGYTKSFSVVEMIGRDASSNPIYSSPIGTNTNLATLSASGYPTNDAQNKRTTFEANLQYNPVLSGRQTLNTQLVYHRDRVIIGSESPYNFQFVSGRVNYGFANKYFAEVGASYSGTEAFPEAKRYGFFPAVSAGWIVSGEDFLKSSQSINFLKLYASAGKVGNAAVGERFSNISQYISGTSYVFGNANAAQSGLQPGAISNPDFTWESAVKYDFGLSATFYKNFDFSFTYFFQKRNNILFPESNITPSNIGATLPNVNKGVTQNTGFETSLFYTKQQSDRGYNIGINASYVTDKIKSLPEATQPNDYLYRAGKPINQPFMLEAIGFFNSVSDIQNSPVQMFGEVKPGDIKYKDQNGDNRIDALDEVALFSTTLPKWDFGFNLGVNIKGFSLNAFFQAQLGRSVYLGSEPILFWPMNNNNGRISTYANQFWTEQTKNTADYPRLSTLENKNNYQESSFWYVNGDFMRLRSIDFGYALPKSFINKAKLSAARLFVRGMNLFTIDHLKYTDPEVLSGYPVMKSYSAGINLQF